MEVEVEGEGEGEGEERRVPDERNQQLATRNDQKVN